jgi:hypothetical protein
MTDQNPNREASEGLIDLALEIDVELLLTLEDLAEAEGVEISELLSAALTTWQDQKKTRKTS